MKQGRKEPLWYLDLGTAIGTCMQHEGNHSHCSTCRLLHSEHTVDQQGSYHA